jgi:hypothetical protein
MAVSLLAAQPLTARPLNDGGARTTPRQHVSFVTVTMQDPLQCRWNQQLGRVGGEEWWMGCPWLRREEPDG